MDIDRWKGSQLSSQLMCNCCDCSEQAIALAILRLVEQEKAVVEGAGAAGVAAILENKLPELKGKR